MLAPCVAKESADVLLRWIEHLLQLWRRRLVPVFAPLGDRAAPAFRHTRLTDITAVQYQPVMSVSLEFIRREFEKAPFYFLGVLPRREVRAVGDAKHVRVDSNCRLAEHRVEHYVGCLSPDTWQRLQRFAVARNFATVLLDQRLR